MTAEEIVMGGYAAFGSGDIETLSKVYHPDCKIRHCLAWFQFGSR